MIGANFPEELGFYKPVVHKENFSNAWVTTGGEINITLNLLKNLGEVGRVCVISHELAHLKSNHFDFLLFAGGRLCCVVLFCCRGEEEESSVGCLEGAVL